MKSSIVGRRSNLLLGLLLAASSAVRADAPGDYACGITLATPGDAAFYAVDVPPVVYAGVVRADVGDVRVFNADGAAVPFALLTRAVAASASPGVLLPLFPLKTTASVPDLAGLTLQMDRNAAGTSVRLATRDGKPANGERLAGYLLDARDIDATLKAIELAWPLAPLGINRRIKVEASDDLDAWRTLVADAPVVDLEFEGRRLLRNRIELPAVRARYLRIAWKDTAPLELTSVLGVPVDATVEPPRQWIDAVGVPVAQHEGDFEFDLGGKAPIDRVAIDLPEMNSVVPAQLFARAAPAAAWSPVTSLIAYRFREGEQDRVSPPVAIAPNTARYWLLRVDPRSGGVHGAAHLRVGGPAQQLVFAARGKPPFSLVYGSATAQPTTLPISTLVPGYGTPNAPAVAPASVDAGAPRALGGAARLAPPIDTTRYLLWAVLVIGVAFMGWMAWRLSTQMKDDPKAAPSDGGAAAGQGRRDGDAPG